jgi:uncharacterized protein
MEFARQNSPSVILATQQFPAFVLTGARQTGKTTLLRATFPRHHYVTLDLPSAADSAEREPEQFMRSHPAPVLIDEVQYAPKLFRHLKIVIDESRHQVGAIILTGSQKFVLMKAVSDSLAGRSALLELETLSFEEIAQHNPYPERVGELMHALVRGGYPDLWRDPNIDANLFYRAYLATYLERDVRQILNVGNLRDFERFIRACAARSGQLLDKASLARDVGVSASAIGDWLSVLEASNQIFLLEPYFENIGKRLVKSPKLYFGDTGMLCYLLGQDERSLPTSAYLGMIWETAIYAQIRKQIAEQHGRTTVWFYRDAQQQEVDFLLVDGNARHLIEAKWTENPDARDMRTLGVVAESLRQRSVANTITTTVVCRTPHESMSASGAHIFSCRKLCTQIRAWTRSATDAAR